MFWEGKGRIDQLLY